MAYKIKWKSGGKTAEAYSNKSLAKRTLKKSSMKGNIVKAGLGKPPRSPLSKKKTVWVRNKPYKGGKGFVYRTRAIDALSSAEKRRVVRR